MTDPNFNLTNNVEIQKNYEQTSTPRVEEEEKVFLKTSKSGMTPQWSYSVKPNDGNWSFNVNGYIDFDPDQNY